MASSSEVQPELGYEDYKASYLNQLPKFGILIPNRLFVGSIPGNTTESELKQFFSAYGHIKDCKIILDKVGVSKGYGFVTFESAEDVSKLLRQEGEHLFFNERKLNIGPAVRKQQAPVSVLENGSAGGLLYTNGAQFAYPHMPLMSGDNIGMAGLPTMASASYPLMVNPHQQFLMQPSCNPSMGLSASALQWAALVGASPQIQWTHQPNNCLPMVPAGHFPVPGSSTQLSLPSTSQYFYQYPQLSAVLPSQEMIYPSAASLQYTDGEVTDNAPSLDPSCAQNNALIMDPGAVSGQVQYFEVSPYAAAAAAASGSAVVPGVVAASIAETLSLAPTAKSSSAPGGNLQKLSANSQSYGVKRVLTIPRQVVCAAPSSHYGFYTVPPVKIIAGQGGQRIVAKSVGTTEIQILPKTQS